MPVPISSAVSVSISSSFISVVFSTSEQLLSCDFSFRHDVRHSGCRSGEEGQEETGRIRW